MPRKTKDVSFPNDNRDKGKVYRITEMSSDQAEAWAARLLLALAKGGAQVPDNVFDFGMAGIALIGVQALAAVPWAEAKPLLDEMFTCLQIKPDPKKDFYRALIPDDIEEVYTRFKLREEILALHTGFSIAEFLSNSASARKAMAGITQDAGMSQGR